MSNLTPDIATAVSAFCTAAETIIEEGLQFARADDPHRFATLSREFDDGRAARRLVVDYLGGGRIRIAQLLIGKSGGESKVVEVFSTMVQASNSDAPAH